MNTRLVPRFIVFLICSTLLVTIGCGQPSPDRADGRYPRDTEFGYDLSSPDNIMKLPHELSEISGLCMVSEEGALAAVQDEKGWIFLIDPKSGKVLRRTTFAKDGDYEGIAFGYGAYWVIKSTGKLYKKSYSPAQDKETEKFGTDLDDIRNIEGLCYDEKNDQLLIACKGPKSADKDHRFEREILAYDLSKMKMKKEPVVTLKREEVHAFLLKKGWKKADDFFTRLVEDLYNEFEFQPSGIAIQPQTGDLYIISFRARALVILDTNYEIKHIAEIPKSILGQPEGITFGEDGTMYISSEGKRGTARIAVYSSK